jgi:dynactin complex subunit
MTSIKEKQVDKVLDRIIGNGDEVLKVITKLAMMNKEITPEIIETIEMLKKQNEEDVKALNDELEMTLDASGNLIPITFTIENNVINNVNGIYRLPVGKT